jgi:beta-N-acetylhexosaminidase
MTSHAVYTALDPELPGTLSRKVVTGLLRQTLGFEGLIITDDLEMGAVRKGWGVARGAVAAFEAGCDLLLICEDQDQVLAGMEMLRNRLLRGDLPVERLHQSTGKIMDAKKRFLRGDVRVSLSGVREYFRKKSGYS